MKKKNEKRTCQKGLVSGDEKQKKGGNPLSVVWFKKNEDTMRVVKEEEEEH